MAGQTEIRDVTMNCRFPNISARGLKIPDPSRGDDLLIRVTAPSVGEGLPVILFSHGYGSSMDGYAPLADYWAANGFVVIQPTHLDARRLALSVDDRRRSDIWRIRVADMKLILDNLDHLARSLPWLDGRAAVDRIAAAGHSFGGQTVSMLLGARMEGAERGEDMRDPRIRAGVLLASGGRGGADLSDFAREHTPWLDSGFDHLTSPTLVVAGDADRSPLTVRGPDWFADPYHLSPGAKALLTLHGGEHMLGGISGYEVAETTDENPARVALVQRVKTAFLRSELAAAEESWTELGSTLAAGRDPRGRIDCK